MLDNLFLELFEAMLDAIEMEFGKKKRDEIQLQEYKECVREALYTKYNVSKIKAVEMVDYSFRNEYLKIGKEEMLKHNPEEWADYIYKFYATEGRAEWTK